MADPTYPSNEDGIQGARGIRCQPSTRRARGFPDFCRSLIYNGVQPHDEVASSNTRRGREDVKVARESRNVSHTRF
jgi:hypothetical protein